MDLKNVSDEELLTRTRTAVQLERKMTLNVLTHLHEIERRRLFSVLGCSSVFTYCVGKLGYSESAAQRRIISMRALKDLPELSEKIESGKLSLSTMASAQTFLSTERRLGRTFSKAETIQLFEELQGKSKREAEKVIAERRSFELLPPAAVKVLKDDKILLSIVVDQEFEQKLEKLKGRLAHRIPAAQVQDVLDFAMTAALEKLDAAQMTGATKKQVWLRAQKQCVLCHSKYALEIDHVQPRAMGGGNQAGNLRLLCRSCNQRQAIEKLGIDKMQAHLGCKRSSH